MTDVRDRTPFDDSDGDVMARGDRTSAPLDPKEQAAPIAAVPTSSIPTSAFSDDLDVVGGTASDVPSLGLASDKWRPDDPVTGLASDKWRPDDPVTGLASDKWRPDDPVTGLASDKWRPDDPVTGLVLRQGAHRRSGDRSRRTTRSAPTIR